MASIGYYQTVVILLAAQLLCYGATDAEQETGTVIPAESMYSLQCIHITYILHFYVYMHIYAIPFVVILSKLNCDQWHRLGCSLDDGVQYRPLFGRCTSMGLLTRLTNMQVQQAHYHHLAERLVGHEFVCLSLLMSHCRSPMCGLPCVWVYAESAARPKEDSFQPRCQGEKCMSTVGCDSTNRWCAHLFSHMLMPLWVFPWKARQDYMDYVTWRFSLDLSFKHRDVCVVFSFKCISLFFFPPRPDGDVGSEGGAEGTVWLRAYQLTALNPDVFLCVYSWIYLPCLILCLCVTSHSTAAALPPAPMNTPV